MDSRALLIAADANDAGVLAQVLEELGSSVERCAESSAAAEKIAARHFDLIVVDVRDAKASSRLLVQTRGSQLNNKSLVISVVTPAQSCVRDAFSLGANFVLYRPVSPDRAKASLRAAGQLLRREKRRHRRFPVHIEARISYPGVESAAAILVELGAEGLAIQSERQLPQKSKIYFHFTLPGQVKCIQLSGETVWRDSSGRVGIRFASVPQVARRLLKEWLNARSAVQDCKLTVEIQAGQPGPLPNSPADRRIQSRHACTLGAEVYRTGSKVPHRCALSDISLGGCYVEMPSPFSTGTAVEVAVHTRNIKFRANGMVQVVHPGFGMGVQFARLTPGQQDQVQQLIKVVYEERAAEADPILRF